MDEQIALFDVPPKKKHTDPKKRAWENAFQRWCDERSQDVILRWAVVDGAIYAITVQIIGTVARA